MTRVLTLCMVLMSTMALAQSDKEKAHVLGRAAIEKMDAGHIEEAIDLLEQAKKLDPQSMDYPYEIGYAHYLQGNYKGTVKVCKKLLKHRDVNSRVYQMLGNSYDLLGNPKAAIKTYDKGLEKFPEAGNLYLERGNMEVAAKKYESALVYYEEGIEAQPTFPSNYYWATKIYLSTDNEIWGMIYGEIFMNLERNSKRTQEISQLLFKTYESEIDFPTDSTATVSFASNTIVISDPSDIGSMINGLSGVTYGLGVYEPILATCVIGHKEITLASLAAIRSSFATAYAENEKAQEHPNRLFEYHKEMVDLGHFEAYSYWVLSQGDTEAFTEWQEEHKREWSSFLEWFKKNPIGITPENSFYKKKY